MSKLYVVNMEEAWETGKHNVEFCLHKVRQGHEKKVSRLFGEDEWAPQQPSAVGFCAVCGRTETKNTAGPVPNIFLLFNWAQFSVQILERIDNDSFHICLLTKEPWKVSKYLVWKPWLIHA